MRDTVPPPPKRIEVIWGATDPKPICNVPKDAIRIKVKLRNDAVAAAFVKFHDRVEHWLIMPRDGQGGGLKCSEWQLGLRQGVNKTTVSRVQLGVAACVPTEMVGVYDGPKGKSVGWIA